MDKEIISKKINQLQKDINRLDRINKLATPQAKKNNKRDICFKLYLINKMKALLMVVTFIIVGCGGSGNFYYQFNKTDMDNWVETTLTKEPTACKDTWLTMFRDKSILYLDDTNILNVVITTKDYYDYLNATKSLNCNTSLDNLNKQKKQYCWVIKEVNQ